MFKEIATDLQSLILQFAFPMFGSARRDKQYTTNFFFADLDFLIRVHERIPSFFLSRTMPVLDDILIYRRSPFIAGNDFLPLAHFDRSHMFNSNLMRGITLMKRQCFTRMKTYKAIKSRRVRRLLMYGISYWNRFLDEFLAVEMTDPLSYETKTSFQRIFIWNLCSSLEAAMYF